MIATLSVAGGGRALTQEDVDHLAITLSLPTIAAIRHPWECANCGADRPTDAEGCCAACRGAEFIGSGTCAKGHPRESGKQCKDCHREAARESWARTHAKLVPA